jgi:hypothetical protein
MFADDKMKHYTFFKPTLLKIILAIVIFIIGLFSYSYMLSCSISFVENFTCYFIKFVAFIFALELFIALIINNFFNLPFNDFNSPIVLILQIIYSYLVACFVFWIIALVNKWKK